MKKLSTWVAAITSGVFTLLLFVLFVVNAVMSISPSVTPTLMTILLIALANNVAVFFMAKGK